MADMRDIAIIGGGPAGLAAGLYACRARMKVVLVEKAICGGQLLISDRIENYPGFPEGIRGPDLAEWMFKQANHFGLTAATAEAVGVSAADGHFSVGLAGGKTVDALSVIVASGARWNTLGIPGEKELAGRGVSYCATCDGPLFRGKELVVIGGGDTAIEDALFLTKFASKVTVVHRRDRLRATKILQERALSDPKIEISFNSEAVSISGSGRCESVEIRDAVTGRAKSIKASGVFVLIGMAPNSGMVKGLVDTDEKGYIICDDEMRTSRDGVFACGDVRKKLLRQVVTAAGDGATAAFSAQHYVDRLRGREYK
jgi:thioredoxin reductase (NADPH)